MTPRGKPSNARPWQWQDKDIHRRILLLFDQSRNVSSALAIYMSLTHIASNEQSETFDATLDHIAEHAGSSGSTVKRVLKTFEAAGIVLVKPNYANGLQLPSTYTLLTGEPAVVHSEPAAVHGGINGPWTTSEESEEESKKNQKETPTLQAKRVGVGIKGFEYVGEDGREIVEHYNATLVPLGWLPVTKISKQLEAALETRHDVSDVLRLINGAAAGDSDVYVPDRKTLVRLFWENY
jgi:hypothetical protein